MKHPIEQGASRMAPLVYYCNAKYINGEKRIINLMLKLVWKRPFKGLSNDVCNADRAVIGFSRFADAALLRACSMLIAALQIASPMRPFNLAL